MELRDYYQKQRRFCVATVHSYYYVWDNQKYFDYVEV